MREVERQSERIIEAAEVEDMLSGFGHGQAWPGSVEDREEVEAWEGTIGELRRRGKRIIDGADALACELERVKQPRELARTDG